MTLVSSAAGEVRSTRGMDSCTWSSLA